MSLFGSLMGDFENDPIFGMHMRSMRQMNNMMNSLFADPFSMLEDMSRPRSSHSLMPFGYPNPSLAGMNRLLGGSLDSLGGDCHSYSSTSVVSMSSGPDGRPQVYRASQSTRTAPGGVREVQRTVCDSRSGTKKMAIGHHIGERAHVIEREQNVHTGDQEERQDFINIEEEEAEDFNREWETKARVSRSAEHLGRARIRHGPLSNALPAITAGPTSRRSRSRQNTPLVSPRRSIRPALALTSSSSSSVSNRCPYSPPGAPQARKHRNVKTVGQSPPDL